MERPLDGVEAKLQRAGEHLERLEADARTFLEREPYRVAVDYDAKIDHHVGKARIIEEPPLTLSVTVGEFAYECISALNHAVWQLAARKRGRHKVEAIKRQVELPVALSRQRFLEKPVIKHRHVSKAAITVLDELQPYHRWRGFEGARHPLWLLKEMSDSDKHRVLAPRWGSIGIRGLKWVLDRSPDDPPRTLRSRWIIRPDSTLEDGTNVMGIQFDIANEQAKVRVEGDLSPEISLGAGEYMVTLRDIRLLALFMNRCLERLSTLFPA